jgi:hypothetical protein
LEAMSKYPGISARQLRGCRVFTALAVLWIVSMIVASVSQGLVKGHGSGFGDGRTYPSCLTPGGPYYPKDWPAEWPRCKPGAAFVDMSGVK